MNKIFRELAGQANFGSIEKGEVVFDRRLDRFAELIVRECISTVENLSPGYQDYRNQIEDAFRRDCVEQIKEHFGLKREHQNAQGVIYG